MRLPADSAQRIETAVGEAEGATSAELVVVGRPFSGSYRDVEYLFGLACALAFLGYALFGKRTVPPGGVISGVATCWILGWVLCRLSTHLRRLMTSPLRRRRQTLDAARQAFITQGIDGTHARTGVLIHLSFLERAVDLVADRGVREAFSAKELRGEERTLEATLRGPAPVDRLCEELVRLGQRLGERLPKGDDDVDELSNAPILDPSLEGRS